MKKIQSIVPISDEFISSAISNYIGSNSLDDVLEENKCTKSELISRLTLPEALRLFSEYHFSPALEEDFLSSKGSHDQVIYSVLRVKNPYLVQELWIRLEEGEATFAELASTFGEGPEASKLGVMGPVPLGDVMPSQIAAYLRTLSRVKSILLSNR